MPDNCGSCPRLERPFQIRTGNSLQTAYFTQVIFNRTPRDGIVLVLSLAALTVAVEAQPPWPAMDSPRPGGPELPAGFAGQLSQARAVLADSWTATAEMIGQSPGSVRLLYEAGPAVPSGPASVEPIAFDHLRDLHRSCTVGIPPDSEVELEVIEAHVAAQVHAPEAAELFAGLAQGPAALGERGLLRRQEVVAIGFGPGSTARNSPFSTASRSSCAFPPPRERNGVPGPTSGASCCTATPSSTTSGVSRRGAPGRAR